MAVLKTAAGAWLRATGGSGGVRLPPAIVIPNTLIDETAAILIDESGNTLTD